MKSRTDCLRVAEIHQLSTTEQTFGFLLNFVHFRLTSETNNVCSFPSTFISWMGILEAVSQHQCFGQIQCAGPTKKQKREEESTIAGEHWIHCLSKIRTSKFICECQDGIEVHWVAIVCVCLWTFQFGFGYGCAGGGDDGGRRWSESGSTVGATVNRKCPMHTMRIV